MPFSVHIRWQPAAAIESLQADEQSKVQAALKRLEEGRFADIPQVYKIRGRAGDPDFHVLRVNERLRLLFTIDQGQQVVTVHDLVNREFVRRYG